MELHGAMLVPVPVPVPVYVYVHQALRVDVHVLVLVHLLLCVHGTRRCIGTSISTGTQGASARARL